MSENQNRILGLVGRKGAGKSKRLAELLQHCPCFLVFDPMEDHAEWVPNIIDENQLGVGQFLDWARQQESFAAAFVPGDKLEEEFEEVCREVYECGDLCFAVEEVALVTQPGYLPPAFGRMVRTGRHRGIDIAWTAQRAAEVSRALTSATDLWVFYSQTEPRDLDAIAQRCGRQVAEHVASLGLHDSFVWDVIKRKVLANSVRLLKRE